MIPVKHAGADLKNFLIVFRIVIFISLNAQAIDFNQAIDQAKTAQAGTATEIIGNPVLNSRNQKSQKKIKIQMTGQALQFTPISPELADTPENFQPNAPESTSVTRGIASVTDGN